ncbi:MAG TPA: PDZ domain-containing protein, partial [Alphaproteobacteria bacterium]|nr:PDZ domain-containing protein [Alphaproteobacteria bacterium]
LYASGDRNRVILAELLERSPAAAAGIEPGDELISYDGERVFRAAELKRLTTEGEAGAPVELRVRREGEIVRLFVERGPLGVRLRMETRPPVR